MEDRSYGIIGLGKMGANLALHVILAHSVGSLVEQLPRPRRIFIYIPAGIGIDGLIDELLPLLNADDIVIDGGNSYWGDSIRRAERLRKEGIYFIDCGTSGGVSGARNGACFMVGGEREAVDKIEPLLKDLAVPNGYIHTGAPGSGHFVKLVHNGIEFGMLQAIGEGMALLDKYREELDISGILKTWNNGSVVRSWLIELMKNIYDEKQGFNVPSYVRIRAR